MLPTTVQEQNNFAMTLHYYSPKEYDFVRKIIKLPHVASIHNWAACLDCEPDDLTDVISFVSQLADMKT